MMKSHNAVVVVVVAVEVEMNGTLADKLGCCGGSSIVVDGNIG